MCSSRAIIVTELLSISISDLKDNDLLNQESCVHASVAWCSTSPLSTSEYLGGVDISVSNEGEEKIFQIRYIREGAQWSEKIQLVEFPSNLGKWYRYYFSCPETGSKCSKLYFYQGRFISRKAIGKAYYTYQVASKNERHLDLLSRKLLKYDKLLYTTSKSDKMSYQGKLTKKTLLLEKLSTELKIM